VQVHGNTLHALCVLGGTVTSRGHGRGEVHGGLGVTASRGIDRARTEEFDGEMTGPEVVGGVLAMLGCPRWAWRWPGRRGVLTPSRYEVGLELGFLQGGDHPLGVEGGGWLSSEGEGFSRKGSFASGSYLPLASNCK
jgi:hypothetical protein